MSALFFFVIFLFSTFNNILMESNNEVENDLYFSETYEDENIIYHLNQLYEDDSNGYVDPFDMVGSSTDQVRDNSKLSSGSATATSRGKIVPNSSKQSKNGDENDSCSIPIQHWKSLLEKQKQLNINLQKELSKGYDFNFKPFYDRILKRFWNLLKMEQLLENEEELSEHYLSLHIEKKDALAFKDYFDEKTDPNEVDSFFYNINEADSCNDKEPLFLKYFSEYSSYLNYFRIEHAILSLGILFVSLCLWALVLFFIDIHKNFKWKNVIFMLMILIFIISCLWHWKHMIKVLQSKRHSQLIKQDNNDIPDDCFETSFFTSIKQSLFGTVSPCEHYYESLMVDPMDEISPLLVISETLTLFFLQPFGNLGTQIGKFFAEFYTNVPLLYQIPATFVVLFLFVSFIFVFFNYGIEFPFWMGGIKPFHREKSNFDKLDIDKIVKESIQLQKEDRDAFMAEAKSMLMSITQAALSISKNQNAQGFLTNSAHIIERELEVLVKEKLNCSLSAIKDRLEENSTSCDPNKSLNMGTSTDIATVTSTPLRSRYLMNTDRHDGLSDSDALHPRLRNKSNLGSSTSLNDRNKISSQKSIEKSVSSSRRNSLRNNQGWHDRSSSANDSDFMLKVRDVLEKSASHEGSLNCSNLGDASSHNEEFLLEVKKVMTP